MDKEMKKKLSEARKTWAGAKERAESEKGYGDFEDGKYKSTIKAMNLVVSKKGNLQIEADFEFLEGDYVGQSKREWINLESEDNQMHFARLIAKLGYEPPEDLEKEIEDLLSEIVKARLVVRITIKTKGDFQHVYVDEVLTDEADVPPAEEAPAEEPAAEEGVELAEGMRVSFTLKGKDAEGEVVKILEAEGKVHVKSDADGKVYSIAADKLALIEETPEEPAEEPAEEVEEVEEVEEEPKKPAKKAAPAKTVVKRKK